MLESNDSRFYSDEFVLRLVVEFTFNRQFEHSHISLPLHLCPHHGIDLTRKGQGRLAGSVAIQLLLKRGELFLIDLGRINGDRRHRLEFRMAFHGDWIGIDLPAEGHTLGGVVDGLIRLLRRGGGGTVHQMQLVAGILLDVVADLGAVRETELGSRLLTEDHAIGDFGATITRNELVREGIGLDRRAERLGGTQRGVFDVVGVHVVCLGAIRGLGDGGQAVPSHAGAISATGLHRVQYAMVRTHLILVLAGIIPSKCYHSSSLKIAVEHVVVKIAAYEMPIHRAHRKLGDLRRYRTIRISIDHGDLIPEFENIRIVIRELRIAGVPFIHNTRILHLDIRRGLKIYMTGCIGWIGIGHDPHQNIMELQPRPHRCIRLQG
nr:MAG TPA: hypothetical protein [Caudoviricetes sp.]